MSISDYYDIDSISFLPSDLAMFKRYGLMLEATEHAPVDKLIDLVMRPDSPTLLLEGLCAGWLKFHKEGEA